jgi:hypothetical protein
MNVTKMIAQNNRLLDLTILFIPLNDMNRPHAALARHRVHKGQIRKTGI